MEHQELQVQWRRDKVQELWSKVHSQTEISYVLQVGLATINRDISYGVVYKIEDEVDDNISTNDDALEMRR
jgi:hypothetical protein